MAVIIVIIITIILYLFTPLSFFHLPLEGEYQVKVTVNDHEMTATIENNTSAMVFKKLLHHGKKTTHMHDYSGMEKVGFLWKGLPSNNEQVTAQPGDITLYIESSLIVYYNQNSWNFTQMGYINNVLQEELKEILGNGNVTMTFELLEYISDSEDKMTEAKSTVDSSDNVENTSLLSKNSEENIEQKIIVETQWEEGEEKMKMYLIVNDHKLTAELVNNSSTQALVELLKKGDLTIDMSDYASMEKVGSFGTSLPTNNEQISTDAGDLILYQGSAFVIYYDTNSWNFTRLGKITSVDKKELKNILGSGDVSVTLSLN